MTLLEYFYNVISIICIADLIICAYQIGKNYFIVKMYGLTTPTKVKLTIDKVVTLLYIAYIIYKIFTHFIFN